MGSILIVDDEPGNLELLTQMLEQSCILYAARSGLAGLTYARQLGVTLDLILLDILMPGLDGYEVCRRLKADERTRDIPVVFLSSLAQAQNKVEGFKVGGVDYITRPFHPDEVLERVRVQIVAHETQRQLREQNALLQDHFQDRLPVGPLRVETAQGTLKIDGEGWHAWFNDQLLELTRSEFLVVLELVQARGGVVSKKRLQAVTAAASQEAVKDVIKRLRAKIPIPIETVRGEGYFLNLVR